MQRPKAATVFGILNIAFGAIGFVGTIFSLVALSIRSSASAQLLNQSPVLQAWTKFTTPLAFISCIVLVIAGIGLLQMKNWARILSIIYAIYALVFGIVGLSITAVFMCLPMLEQAQQKPGPESIGMMVGAIGAMIGGVIGLAYPVLLLIFMLRPKLVEAFRMARQSQTPQPTYPPSI